MPMALSLALYSTLAQVSWVFSEWWLSVRDLEKGFCGWACGKLGLEDCSPYSIVELLDSDNFSGSMQGNNKVPGEDAQTSSVWDWMLCSLGRKRIETGYYYLNLSFAMVYLLMNITLHWRHEHKHTNSHSCHTFTIFLFVEYHQKSWFIGLTYTRY